MATGISGEPRRNALGQPIGPALPDWSPSQRPVREPIEGRLCRLEPLCAERHAADLHSAYRENTDGGNWTYLPYGPFGDSREYSDWALGMEGAEDPLAFAIVDRATSRPVGVATFLRITPAHGTIEVGHLSFAPALQRTIQSTEAMFLMMRRVFDDWDYRRYEWKCDSLNGPSIAAAQRLGFRREGTFQNHVVMKGRSRDTTWFSILDSEWPELRQAFESWLSVANFDDAGRQRDPLSSFMPKQAGLPRT